MEYSVVTALYNGLEYTQAYLKSLEKTMHGEAYEVILVDDGSTDGTREFLESISGKPNFKVHFNEQNLGFARSNNIGVGGAEGKYLLLLNNDLLLTRGWLKPMRQAMEQEHVWLGHKRKAGVVGNLQSRMDDKALDHAGVYFSVYATPAHAFKEQNYRPLEKYTTWSAATAACWLVETEFFRSLGGFDERYINGMEDIDFCLQALERGRVAVVANRSRIKHAVSASRIVSKEDENNYRKLWEKWRYPLHELAAVDQARYAWIEGTQNGGWLNRLRGQMALRLASPFWKKIQDRAKAFLEPPQD